MCPAIICIVIGENSSERVWVEQNAEQFAGLFMDVFRIEIWRAVFQLFEHAAYVGSNTSLFLKKK